MSRHIPTYWDYLDLEKLLSTQKGLEEHESHLMPDELHFIVIHQTLELWLKLIMSELRLARDHLDALKVPEEDIPHVVHHMKRMIEILKLCTNQFDVVETLTPRDFLGFRDKLFPASGFQSYQMREMEVLLGMEEKDRISLGGVSTMDYLKSLAQDSKGGQNAWATIEKAQKEVPLKEALHKWLYRCPIHGSRPSDKGDDKVVEAFLEDYLAAWRENAASQLDKMASAKLAPLSGLQRRFEESLKGIAAFLQAKDIEVKEQRQKTRRLRAAAVFVESYRELPLLAWPRLLLDTVVELEERLVLFRQRHARMAERIIGRRVGTGGSDGVDYLDATSKSRIFKDLWTVRTVLLSKDALPPIINPDFYNFVSKN